MDRRPEIQHVPLDATIRREALKRVLAQMDREGSLPVCGVAVHRAGTTALIATAVELSQQPQVPKHLFQGDLLTHEGEVHLGSGGRGGRRRRLDRRGRRLYGETSRGD